MKKVNDQLDLFNAVATKKILVKNRTRANKVKSSRLKAEYILPYHNIKETTITATFLKSLLELHNNGETVESILYNVGIQLAKKELPEYSQFKKSSPSIVIPKECFNEFDLLGSIYQYLTTKYDRLARGSFYTSQTMINAILSRLEISSTDTFFDPACGSGNLLFNDKIKNPKQIYGIDNDPIAIMCCKFNYYIRFGCNAPIPNIHCTDFITFFKANQNKFFTYILCNPPFGATIDVSALNDVTVETEDSLTYFVEHGSKLGNVGIFILPESVINVKKHTELRKWILTNTNLERIISFGANFAGTMFPIVTLFLNNTTNTTIFDYDGKKVSKETIKSLPFYYFRPIDEKYDKMLHQVFSLKGQSLLGSEFGLGVVTGDNKTKLFDTQINGSEPIITGKDIKPFSIKKPTKYLIFDRSKLQQVAPDELYRAKEKIVYKTVSRDMIFAIEDTKALTLNSANFFIPKGLTLSNKCLVGLLNSTLFNELNHILYGENKISRTNLENLPLPNMPKDVQKQIETYIDKKDYVGMNKAIYNYYGL